MRKVLIVCCLILIHLTSTAQKVSEADKKAINKRMDGYVLATNDADWTGLMEYIYPRLFELASKADVVAAFSSLDQMGIKMAMSEMTIKEFRALGTVGDERFVGLPYSADVFMKLTSQDANMNAMMASQFKLQFGEENVSYNQETNEYKLFQEKTMIGIYRESVWYFIEYDEAKSAMFSTIMPAEILEKVKEI